MLGDETSTETTLRMTVKCVLLLACGAEAFEDSWV